jgi:PhnB protein
MPIQTLNPYLIFNGTARQAIQLYEDALGVKTEHIVRFGDGPCTTMSEEVKDYVMHARLRVGDTFLMISDTTPDRPAPSEGNVQINLLFTDVESMDKAFAALSTGGSVKMPLGETFWAARFGMLIDRFGIAWMFNHGLREM